ncbi:hypothetical protein KUL156_33540 [Alteromonas sp. KUL156]|uniref:DUF885 domain-containing protein n=1 Tax=Tenacibaculum TaxID=104267 RepID=UPI0012E52F21|nr:DUF885 domain-containing protein [Tenacibaculum mesophilum]KAF9658098.1 DUF885 domain-containing protein [Tenacibaculum mesophilum]GFD92743.1 hypothetical protein KUL154_14760 [Alteromonas sp. KUL154]GFE00762.1 hypothetical protein KUL156_33540 [Alteromonas sp. KUL156]
MKKIFLTIVATATLLTSCKQEKKEVANIPTPENMEFNQLLKDYNEGKLQLNPVSATFAGDNRFNDQFPNTLSDEYQAKSKEFYKNYKTKLNNFKDTDLTESQQMSKAVLDWDCDMALAQASYKNDLLMPINQMWTINLTMGQLASGSSAQPFKTVEDYDNWLSRLNKYNTWLQSAKERMQQGIKEGYVLPKSLIKKVIPQFESLTIVKKSSEGVTDFSEHLFYSPINTLPTGFSDADKTRLTEAYTNILNDKLIPSFKAMYEFLKTDYLAAGRESSGISDIPNGTAYYQHAIKNYTTTNMTADEIHELGLKEVARILSEMEKVKEQVGFEGNLKEFFDFVRNNKELMPYTEPQQIIDNFNAIHEKMKPQLEKLFGNKPKTPFVVKQTEKFREASASAEYNPGSLDGTRPGVFYTPIPDATKYNVFSDEALFLHEAIPGHHYQISLTQENEDLPDFRKTLWYSAYGEGWALYTENLGKELGLYTDPYQYFGMLGMEMHRAIRLVVDTGIHSKGWSREKAIQYSLDNEAEGEASIISEIERYMANPGQALSYKIGQLKIRELRAKAKKELGDKFDIKEFHNQVLETGCIPLALLENKIDKWIASLK